MSLCLSVCLSVCLALDRYLSMRMCHNCARPSHKISQLCSSSVVVLMKAEEEDECGLSMGDEIRWFPPHT